ncbi:hypothetical protein HOA91_06875 [Candidatus Woesearchaeota archaeon]|jgi:hypothetical protein|nr:hypothetical protein [Candidatus Woesearchaeota archaeon]
MKKIILFSLILLIFVIGCAEEQMEASSGEDVEVEIETSGINTGEWCEKGAEWKYAAEMETGTTNAKWTNEGMIESGKYAGLCHVIYTSTGPEGSAKMDYYFSEDGESGYFELDVNGQKIASEWSK